jgi:kinesin family protein 6/9
MIATLSLDFDDVHETMSTCRFSQRVSRVKNIAVRNEIEDNNVLIQKQKYQIEELKSELAIIKGKEQKSYLEKEDIAQCRKIAEEYLSDDDYSRKIDLKEMIMIQECFSQIKIMYKDMEKKAAVKEVVVGGEADKDKIIELENMNKKLTSEI